MHATSWTMRYRRAVEIRMPPADVTALAAVLAAAAAARSDSVSIAHCASAASGNISLLSV